MFDLVKKAMFTGVGLASLTKEKVDELGKDLSRHAKLSQDEAEKFQAELERRASSAQKDLQDEIDRRIEQAIGRLGLARSEETANLSAKVAALTARVEALEATLSVSERPAGASPGGNGGQP